MSALATRNYPCETWAGGWRRKPGPMTRKEVIVKVIDGEDR